jgi:valyl-tRNA synthetase
MGYFICMFASLSKKITSNHGIRFFVTPGNDFKITKEHFEVKEIVHKSWEADIFYKRNIPDYLYHDVYEETIGLAELIIPERLYADIQKISASISHYYENLDFNTLPKAYIEELTET